MNANEVRGLVESINEWKRVKEFAQERIDNLEKKLPPDWELIMDGYDPEVHYMGFVV